MRESKLAARIWVPGVSRLWRRPRTLPWNSTALDRIVWHEKSAKKFKPVRRENAMKTRYDHDAPRKRFGRCARSRRQAWRPEGHAEALSLNPQRDLTRVGGMLRIKASCAMSE